MNAQALHKLTKARISLISQQVFWGTLALRLRLIEDSSIPTLAVDGKSVWYNPDFILSLSPDLVKAAMAHEVGHCVFEHTARRGNRDPMLWNMAGDYVINARLKCSGFQLGDGWLYNPDWEDVTSDWVYTQLQQNAGARGGGTALCEIRDADIKKHPDLVDDWKIATVTAATAAKKAGQLPADLERFVTDLVNPKTDWRTILRRFVTEISNNDYSWARPKKSMAAHGIYMPSLYSESMGTLVVVSDDSGSIGGDIQAAFSSEIQAARDAAKPLETIFISCDAAINHVETFQRDDEFTFTSKGGGGTDFRPPFDYLEEHGIKPSAMIYLTDLYGPAPQVSPDYPVLWCCTSNQAAPWGERVQIEV